MENVEHVSQIDDELYGALLSANQTIDDAGGRVTIFLLLAGVVVSLGLHLSWFDQLLNIDLSNIRHWYVYIIIVVVAFVVCAMVCPVLERAAYNKFCGDISTLAHGAGLSKYQLVASIAGDEDLKNVSEWIRKDTSLEL